MSKFNAFLLLGVLCSSVYAEAPANYMASSDSPSVWKAHTYFSLNYANDDNNGSFDDPNVIFEGGVTMTRDHYYLGFQSESQGLIKKENRDINTTFGAGILNHYGKSLRYNLALSRTLHEDSDVNDDTYVASSQLLWRNLLGFAYQYTGYSNDSHDNDTSVFVQHTFGAAKQNWAELGYQYTMTSDSNTVGNDSESHLFYAQYSYRLKPTSAWYVGAFYIREDIASGNGLNIVGVTLQHGLNFINNNFAGGIFRHDG